MFISYSRGDKRFVVERLLPKLIEQERDVWIDVEDIPPAADWRETVLEAVAQANAFVFVLSPRSLDSARCAEELERAVALKKRVIPVLCESVDHKEVPSDLERPNWVFLRDGDDFDAGVARLAEALDTDLDWRRAHTRLAVRTAEWARAGQDRSFLLRGSDLESAESWLAEQGSHAETATPEQADYIVRSRRAASRRHRITLSAVATALVIALALAALAWWQRQQAVEQARLATSRELAASSLTMRERDPELSVLLAAEASRTAPTDQAEDALRQALLQWPARRALAHRAPVDDAEHSADGRLIVTASGGVGRLFDAVTDRFVRQIESVRGVTSARFSPDGRHVLLTTAERAVIVEAASGQAVQTLSRGDLVRGARYSDDGRRVVVATVGGARVFDARSGGRIATLDDPELTNAAELTRRGDFAVTYGPRRTARVWEVATGRTVAVLRHARPLVAASISPDGRLVATATLRGSATVWALPTGRRVTRLEHLFPVNGASFSGDGRLLFTTGADGKLWDTRRRRTVGELRHQAGVLTSAFSPDGRRLVTGDAEGIARVWDVGGRRVVNRLSRHAGPVRSAAFSPDGRFVLTAGRDRFARLWEAEPGSSVVQLRRGREVLKAAEVSADGQTVATSSDRGVVRLWSAVEGRLEANLSGPGGEMTSVAFSPDGELLIGAGKAGRARIWRSRNRRPVATLEGHRGEIADASISPNGRHVATAGEDGTVRLWETETGRPLGRLGPFGDNFADRVDFALGGRRIVATFTGEPGGVGLAESPSLRELGAYGESYAHAVRPDGHTLAIGRPSGVNLTRADSGQEFARFDASDGVFDASFGPGGRLLAGVGTSGTGYVWDLRSGDRALHVRAPPVYAVTIGPGSRFAALGHEDGLVRIFELPSGEQVATLGERRRKRVNEVAFAGDGRSIVAVEKDGGAWVYRCDVCASQARLIRLARERAARPPTAEERRRYLHDEPE